VEAVITVISVLFVLNGVITVITVITVLFVMNGIVNFVPTGPNLLKKQSTQNHKGDIEVDNYCITCNASKYLAFCFC